MHALLDASLKECAHVYQKLQVILHLDTSIGQLMHLQIHSLTDAGRTEDSRLIVETGLMGTSSNHCTFVSSMLSGSLCQRTRCLSLKMLGISEKTSCSSQLASWAFLLSAKMILTLWPPASTLTQSCLHSLVLPDLLGISVRLYSVFDDCYQASYKVLIELARQKTADIAFLSCSTLSVLAKMLPCLICMLHVLCCCKQPSLTSAGWWTGGQAYLSGKLTP